MVRGRGLLAGRSVVTILIWINVVIFLLCSITTGNGGTTISPITAWLAFYTPAIRHGQIWRLITSQYLHWNSMHILFNMLGLHFLGRQLERDWGPRQFFAVYTVAGLMGNFFLLALTLNGWFNPNAMTAAHKTLPFGTKVRVTHLGNGRSVDVTINDRGPYIAGRIIDLSKAAAGVIGMTGQGIARVAVEVLGR